MEKKFEFKLEKNPALFLKSVIVKTEVSVGNNNDARVVLIGPKEYTDLIDVSLLGYNSVYISGQRLDYSGPAEHNRINQTIKIQVVMPLGSKVDVSDAKDTSIKGLNGLIIGRLRGQETLNAMDVLDINLICSGNSTGDIKQLKGHVGLMLLGESEMKIDGCYNDVRISATDDSRINVMGSCRNIFIGAEKKARVFLSAEVRGHLRDDIAGQALLKIS